MGVENVTMSGSGASTWLKRYKHGSREIGISELAELFGVSTEALRKYEAKDIIRPFRDERGYRKFHSWDLTKIIRARQMRQEGFSLADMADSMQNDDAQGQIAMMEDLQTTLMQEIQYRRKLIRWLAAQRDEVMRAEQAGDRCMIEHQSALHCCIYMVDDTLVDKQGEERKQFKAWLQALPFANVCYIGGVGETAYSCLVLTEEEKMAYGLEHLTPDFVIPERSYVVCYSAAEHDPQHDTSEQCFMESKARVLREGLLLDEYIVARMIRYVQCGDWYRSVNKMCFPIAED